MTAPRITLHGNRWLCHLSQRFITNCGWKEAKSPQAAKNALIAAVRDWCRMAGLDGPEGSEQ